MTLMLHAGANPVEYAALRDLPIPEATATHVRIPHYRIVDLIKSTLGMYGHVVEEEHYGVTPDGFNFFGALSLKSSGARANGLDPMQKPSRGLSTTSESRWRGVGDRMSRHHHSTP